MNTIANAAFLARAPATAVRVTRVETIPLRVPFRVPFQIAGTPARPVGEQMIVRLHTDEGVVGIGETQAWRRQGSSETLGSLKCAIDEHLAPRVVGRSPFALAQIMHDMDAALYHSYYAKAAIADALYDLQGKLLGVPVYLLLGGKCRDTVGACAVLTIKDTVEATLESAAAFAERGFTSFTIKIGVDAAFEVPLVRKIREQYPDAIIRVDANASMGFDDALALLKKIEPYGIDAAEQPVALWDLDSMAELARRVNIPLMADESLGSEHDLVTIIKRRAATVIQTKVAKNGGIWHMRKLWTIADAAGMRIYPGNHPSTSVATAAVAHLAAAWPGPLLDGPFAVGVTGAFADDIVESPLLVEGGAVRVSDAPGLGVVLDEAAIRRLRVDR
jgi:L-alanine-DL-glutamate epimerase-like enolase superfamily enzyme